MKVSDELVKRGFIHQISGESLADILDGEKRTIYHGVDPSADSIHAGNFAAWMLLRRLKDAGHTIILVVGGGTGMIGDPKPDVERPLSSQEEVEERVQKLSLQARQLLGEGVIFVNNYEWLGELKLIDFLRDIGKHFTVNELIKKDAISTRLKSENGISYTEFAYPLLQGYDYLELHQRYGCDVQIGGSDQWGNIVAGVDLIRKKMQKVAYAITIPLIIDKSTGKKFGKSEGNAVWLDAQKTSPFAFYQFWLNVSDENVSDYLKIFTFFSLEEISALEAAGAEEKESRVCQKALAKSITSIVHGEVVAEALGKVTEVIFEKKDLESLTESELTLLKEQAPTTPVTLGTSVLEVLIETGLAQSKREARTFIEEGAVTIGGEKIVDVHANLQSEYFTQGVAIIRRGKKQVHVLTI